ncbi:MAG: DUF7021 domain-containing protein [Lawsonibacter sp.]
MFGFFKKKGGEVPEEQQRQQRGRSGGRRTRQDAAEVPQELRALGQDFLPEELEILAVTGGQRLLGGQGSQGESLWTASIGLTAWMEEDSPDIHQGDVPAW